MKKILLLFVSLSIFLGSSAQITITGNDLPVVGDTIRLSNAAALIGIDPSLTGPGFTWDFSNLTPQSQVVEGYVSPQSTPFLYQIIFNSSVSNLASPITGINFLPGIEVTDAYIFYKSSSTAYVRAGYAATLAGVPIPMKFDNPEVLMRLPMQAGNPADSSMSAYSLQFPGIGYFSIERKRVNQVDGWGTLTTPYGTFNTLRLKSVVHERDSLYVDSVQYGAPVNRLYTEYKWFASGYHLPVLTFTEEGPLLTAQYIDTIHDLTPLTVDPGPDQVICKGDTISLEAQVNGGTPPYAYLWSTLDTTATIKVAPETTTSYSVLVTDALNAVAVGSLTVTVNEFKQLDLGADTLLCAESSINLDAGDGLEQITWYVNGTEMGQGQTFELDSTGIGLNNAIIRVEYMSNGCPGSDEIGIGFYICGGVRQLPAVKVSIMPNPVDQYLTVDARKFQKNVSVLISSADGRLIHPDFVSDGQGKLTVLTDVLAPGLYFLIISDTEKQAVARFIRH